jgi:hypothetical protein
MNDEPHRPSDSLSEEEKLKYMNDVLKQAGDLLKSAFSPEQYISEIYSLTCMENDFHVILSGNSLKAESRHRGIEEVEWDKLKKISIVTNDKGPFTADVFLVLLTDTGGCVVPQGNDSYSELYEKVTAFENVNFENVIKAMSSSANSEFVVWESK